MMKNKETFYGHTALTSSCFKVKYVCEKRSFWNKEHAEKWTEVTGFIMSVHVQYLIMHRCIRTVDSMYISCRTTEMRSMFQRDQKIYST